MTTVVLISDFNILGSGYKTIVVGIGMYLCGRGIDVKLLAANDRGTEHNYPFSVIPVSGTSSTDEIWGLLQNMKADFGFDDVLILADMPVAHKIVDRCKGLNVSFSGLFPLEAPPLTPAWATRLMSLKECFLMTKFGAEALEQFHVHSTFIPIPVNTDIWAPIGETEREEIRNSVGLNGFTLLTVAENQERKNISCAAEIVSKLPNAKWVLVTRTSAQWGWNIPDLLRFYNIEERTLVIEKGMPESALKQLYQAADALLVTSKAEGLALPVLEAMACGLLVIAPFHTALGEHLGHDRGLTFSYAYQYLDPFGNQYRYFASVYDGVRACKFAMQMDQESRCTITNKALEYVRSRSWNIVGETICQKLGL